MEKDEFVKEMLSLLPAIYLDFSSIDVEDLPEQSEFEYFASYVDEDFLRKVCAGMWRTLMGPDDVFLETFEEDMEIQRHADRILCGGVSCRYFSASLQ